MMEQADETDQTALVHAHSGLFNEEEKQMKKMVLLVTAMAFLATGSLAMARRDANRDALQQQWKQQLAEQKKIDAQLKAGEPQTKSPAGDATVTPSLKKESSSR